MANKKIAKITDEQYLAYIAGLKENAASLVDSDGQLLVPDAFVNEEEE